MKKRIFLLFFIVFFAGNGAISSARAGYRIAAWSALGAATAFLSWKLMGKHCEGAAGNLLASFCGLCVAEKVTYGGTSKNDWVKGIVLGLAGATLTKFFFNKLYPPCSYSAKELQYQKFYGENKNNPEGKDFLVIDLPGFGGDVENSWLNPSSNCRSTYSRPSCLVGQDLGAMPKNTQYLGCNFPDASITCWAKVNLGQDGDGLIALWHLIKAYEKGHRKIVLFGHSRGGATAITLAHYFVFPDEHAWVWKQLGVVKSEKIDTERIKKMWKSVVSIFLAHPLLNIKKISLLNATEELRGGRFVAESLISWFSNVNFQEKTHFEKLKEIFACKNATLPLFKVFLVKNDEVVANNSDDLMDSLKKGLPLKRKKKLDITRYAIDRPLVYRNSEVPYHVDIRTPLQGLAAYLANK